MSLRLHSSPDGARVLSGSKDKTLKLWDASTGRLLRTATLQLPAENVDAVALSPDGARALSGAYDKAMKLWDVATGGRLIRTFATNSSEAVAFSPDGARAVSGGMAANGHVKLWDVATGRLVRTFNGHKSFSPVGIHQSSPNGTRVLSAAMMTDETVKLWGY